jgi:hypothetical protein
MAVRQKAGALPRVTATWTRVESGDQSASHLPHPLHAHAALHGSDATCNGERYLLALRNAGQPLLLGRLGISTLSRHWFVKSLLGGDVWTQACIMSSTNHALCHRESSKSTRSCSLGHKTVSSLSAFLARKPPSQLSPWWRGPEKQLRTTSRLQRQNCPTHTQVFPVGVAVGGE